MAAAGVDLQRRDEEGGGAHAGVGVAAADAAAQPIDPDADDARGGGAEFAYGGDARAPFADDQAGQPPKDYRMRPQDHSSCSAAARGAAAAHDVGCVPVWNGC